ncbi:MAG TPA: hypothetical protein VI172_08450 [Candidatus Dormibacteraeota bacterium]|jgi:hypothetical protein
MTMSSSVHDRTQDLSGRRNNGPSALAPLSVQRHRTNAGGGYQARHAKPDPILPPMPVPLSDTRQLDIRDLKAPVPAPRRPDAHFQPSPGLERTRITQLPEQGIAPVRSPMSVPESEQALQAQADSTGVLERILAWLKGGR